MSLYTLFKAFVCPTFSNFDRTIFMVPGCSGLLHAVLVHQRVSNVIVSPHVHLDPGSLMTMGGFGQSGPVSTSMASVSSSALSKNLCRIAPLAELQRFEGFDVSMEIVLAGSEADAAWLGAAAALARASACSFSFVSACWGASCFTVSGAAEEDGAGSLSASGGFSSFIFFDSPTSCFTSRVGVVLTSAGAEELELAEAGVLVCTVVLATDPL